MANPYGIKSVHTSTSAVTLFIGPFYLKGLHFSDGSAGVVVFRDGGASGLILLEMHTSSSSQKDVAVPGPGLLFETSCYVTTPNNTNLTIFYGP